VPTPRDAYRQAMRDQLIAAAAASVARKGLAGFTIRDVLAEAGVAPGTLYAYFSGKDELVAALAQELVGRVVDESMDAHAVLSEILDETFSAPMDGSALLADLRGRVGDDAHAAMVRNVNQELVGGLRPLVERARDEGDLAVDDVDAFVELLDILWDGLTRRSGADTFVTSYERVGAVMLDLLALRERVASTE